MSIVVVAPTMPRGMSAPSVMPVQVSQLFSRPGGGRSGLGGGPPLALRGRAAVFWGSLSTGPHRGSTINVLDGLLATGRLALATIAQKVRQNHVVPAARWADFDDDNLEFPELMRHLLQLGSAFDPTGVLAQLVAEDVAEHNHVGRLTHRARTAGRFAVVLRRADQQRVGITRVMAGQRAAGALKRLEGGATLQRIVDDLALRPHGKQEYVASRVRVDLAQFACLEPRGSLDCDHERRVWPLARYHRSEGCGRCRQPDCTHHAHHEGRTPDTGFVLGGKGSPTRE